MRTLPETEAESFCRERVQMRTSVGRVSLNFLPRLARQRLLISAVEFYDEYIKEDLKCTLGMRWRITKGSFPVSTCIEKI